VDANHDSQNLHQFRGAGRDFPAEYSNHVSSTSIGKHANELEERKIIHLEAQ
jgi:hypothetical protein